MRALKTKLHAHTYRDTTEIQHYAKNKQCKDTMVQFNKVSDDAGQWNGHDVVISVGGIFL